MCLKTIFSTPIWITKYENFEEEKNKFLESGDEYRRENPQSEFYSNRGGYQSPKQLYQKEGLSNLFNFICGVSNVSANQLKLKNKKTLIASSWINYNETKEAMNIQHSHDGVFSGVFYLKTPVGCGNLILVNPHINAMWRGCVMSNPKDGFTSEHISIKPKEGQLILWPSYLEHFVEPNTCDECRISISFNIQLSEN